MPDPVVPAPFFRTLVQSLVPTKQTTKVTGADTETATRWEVGEAGGAAKAVAQKSKLVGLDTETTTDWKAVSAKGAGMGLDEFIRGSAVVPMGTRVAVAVPKPAEGARLASQATEVTGARTLTKTAWKVDGEGDCQTMTATDQQTKLESFDTKTRTKWVFPD